MIRCGFAVIMLFSVLIAWSGGFDDAAPGLGFFAWICNLNVLLISVSGISYFVSAVTEEKDAGTLSLLRLAGVSPLAVVLSKSTSRLISALMLLLIQLPFTFLAITLGGISWQQIISSYLALAAWLCMVANVALLCSVWCRTSGRAAAAAAVILLGFFASGPLLTSISTLTPAGSFSAVILNMTNWLAKEQKLFSVVPRLADILDPLQATTFWSAQLWRNGLVGLVTFSTSVLLFNFFTESIDPNRENSAGRMRLIRNGRCWSLPIIWKDFLFFTGGRTFILVKAIAYTLLVFAFYWFHHQVSPNSRQWLSRDLTEYLFLTLTVCFSVEMLLYASSSLFQEVSQKTIPTLAMLPQSTASLLLQKLGAAGLALLPGMATLGIVFLANYSIFLDQKNFVGNAVGWLFLTLVSSHLTVLLSLYTRWAALPLAVLLTAISFPCVAGAAIGLMSISTEVAGLGGIGAGQWFGVGVNLVWMWLFILLPIEIEIVNRWNRLSRE